MSTQPAEWIQAARVLRRIGFGARGSEIDAAVRLGKPAFYVERNLDEDFRKDPGVVASPMPDIEVLDRPDPEEKAQFQRYREETADQLRDLTHWWISRMVTAENPTNEKLTFLWHSHFATSAIKVAVPARMASQNRKLRDLCLGDFRTLAYAMLTDAAMIKWLDGHENKMGSPNENLAREFLELFALGHGNGYSETDVREGARALTGWTINERGDAELVAERHDASIKTVLQRKGKIGAREFCDVVVNEPESARFVASRLWQQLASDSNPSQATLGRLVGAYGSKYDLRALTSAILTDSEFLEARATIVTPPIDWMVGLLRAVRAPLEGTDRLEKIARWLNFLGQKPFYPPDVGGWPHAQAWLSSAAANIRLRTASKLVKDGDLSSVAEAAVNDRVDAAGYLIGVGAWSDRSVRALKPLRKSPAALVAAAVNTPEYLTC